MLHQFSNDVIKQRYLQRQQTKATVQRDDFGLKKRQALLDVLLDTVDVNGRPLSPHDIREEVDTFIFTGHDTTTSCMNFALWLLSRHDEVQQKLYEEVIQVLGGDFDKPVALSDLANLKYAEIVIKETLRLYPSVPNFGRTIEEDFIFGIFNN